MAKISFKKPLSFILASAIICSVCAVNSSSWKTSAETINIFSSDDFSSAAKTDSQLVSGAGVKLSGSIKADGTNNYFHNNSSDNMGLLMPNSSYWPSGNVPTEVEFDYKLSSSTGNFSDINAQSRSFFFAYDETNNVGIGLNMLCEGGEDGKRYLVMRTMVSGTGFSALPGDNSGKIIAPRWADTGNIVTASYETWFHIKGEADYTKLQTAKTIAVTYTVTVQRVYYDGDVRTYAENVTVKKTFTYTVTSALGGTLKPAFSCTRDFDLDNIRVVSASSIAQEYKTKYAELLAKDYNSMGEEDTESFIAAANEYALLSDVTKKQLAAESQKLQEFDRIYSRYIQAFSTDSFDKAWYSSKYWTGSPVISKENNINYINPGSGVTLNSTYWPKNVRPASASIKFKGAGYIYFIYDESTKNGCGLFIEGGRNFKRSEVLEGTYTNKGDASGTAITGPYLSSSVENYDIRSLQYSSTKYWTTLDMQFDYTNFSKGKLKITYTLTATTADGTQTNTIPAVTLSYDLGTSANVMQDFRPHIKAENSYMIDSFSYTPENQAALKAGVFKEKYSSILEKNSYSEFSQYEISAFETAKTEYFAFDAETKQILILDGTTAKIARLLQENAQTTKYRSDYADVFSLTSESVRPSHNDRIQAALSDYNALSQENQIILNDCYQLLIELQQALDIYVEPRKSGDYSDFTENFEQNLINWKTDTKDSATVAATHNFKIVDDPENAENKVLSVETNGAFLTVRDILWPSDGVMTSATFRMKVNTTTMEGSPYNKNKFIYSYLDVNNYMGCSYNAAGTMVSAQGLDDGEACGQEWTGTGGDVNIETWFNVSVEYNGNLATIVIYDEEDHSISATLRTNFRNGRLAFGTAASVNFMSNFYIDDVKIKFQKGDFDNNTPPESIQVYYSGNTQLKPGETALISGENLYNTVSRVEIMQLPDNSDSVSYIKEMSYQSLGSEGGVTPTWIQAEATDAQVVQWTATSLKFLIPESYNQGVYAVKLYAKIPGQQDVIIYINNPDISFINGDEGTIATPCGYVRVIGSNISLDLDKAKVSAVLKSGNGTIYNLTDVELNNDEYSLKAVVPANVPYGTYQVLVHNGYGDSTAWSQPYEITVGPSPRDSWSKVVFNVKDYGATGDSETNDTPAVVKALEAAAENGGGIVYFPRGIYRLVTTIVIPENVVFKGDGTVYTKIMWTPKHWQIGKAPDVLVSFTDNVEICDISFYGTRHKTIFRSYKNVSSENVYMHDLFVEFTPYSGAVTAGDGSATGALTSAELKVTVDAELRIGFYMRSDEITNIQCYNVENVLDGTNGYGIHGKYLNSYFDNFEFDNLGWCAIGSTRGLIIENCMSDWSCMGICGNVYVNNCSWEGPKSNNHEIMTTDGTHLLDGVAMQFIGDKPEILAQYGITQTDNVTYRLFSNRYAENVLVNYDVYVIAGQGLGQTRKIVWNNGYVFRINEQFSVVPNRNSLIALQSLRSNQYFINCHWENGGACGTYGSMINTVFDGNTYSKHGGQIFNTHAGVNWYITVKNAVLEDPFYMHGDGVGGTAQPQTDIGRWQFMLLHGLRAYSSMGITFKNNSMLDGSFLSITVPNTNYLRDFIIENNYFSDLTDVGIKFVSTNGADGVLLLKNRYDSNQRYSDQLSNNLDSLTLVNKIGTKRFLSLEQSSHDIIMGDINLDGKVSLKDATLLRYYLLGKITLTAENLKRADMDSDGTKTINDVNLIRKAIR